MSVHLDTPVQYVKGVGPRRAQQLEKAGIRTVEDLLQYRPFRYEDRTGFRTVAELRLEQEAVIQVQVLQVAPYSARRKRMEILELRVGDSSGQLSVKFFNQPYLQKVFQKGQEVIFFGAPRVDSYSRQLTLLNPEFEILEAEGEAAVHTGRIVPVYRKIGPLTTRVLRSILFRLLEDLKGVEMEDPLPAELRKKYGFPERGVAFRQLHFPDCPEGPRRQDCLRALESGQAPCQQRFIFEEFFTFQLGLQLVRKRRTLVPKPRIIRTSGRIREVLKSILPFRPTPAQKRVLKEIVEDLCSPQVMNRLLQGDVGSGKTIVALQAMVVVMENGYQTALMAPTEILAEQHFENLQGYLRKTPYQVELLTSRVTGKARQELQARIRSGEVHLLVGTHALIQEEVEYQNLGMVVIDEQHRFGVLQRSRLMEKGQRPDTLVMTATPIPRSLALTVYGDLEVSVLDELPPGRQPVKTVIKAEASRREVYRVLRSELEKGRQVYVVYPLIEQSENVDLRAATEMAEQLQKQEFPQFRVGLMHGRLKTEEKDELMKAFKEGDLHILVSTTVIEVGIDVPNATVMLIEHADRFGLSQLHQLRGRIGRGAHPGLCILMVDMIRSREAYQRLDIMRKTSDGFQIAEKDLEIRGPGEFVGTRQSGLPEFSFGNIVRDRQLLELARQEAERYSQNRKRQPGTPDPLWSEVERRWRERFRLFEVG